MFDAFEAMQCLVDDDYNTIMSGDANDYLVNLLTFGHKGYETYSDDELIEELKNRGLEEGFGI